jgi:hypothetical protein
VPNLRPRALATLKRLFVQHDKKQIFPLFAWGRMTLTIRAVSASDTDPVMELWKPRRHEIVAVLAYIHIGLAADLFEQLGHGDYQVCFLLVFRHISAFCCVQSVCNGYVWMFQLIF